jgi:hypothetical protein
MTSAVAVLLFAAADTGSLHVFNADVNLSERWRLTLHFRLRTYHHLGQYHEARTGPILQFTPHRRITLQQGYYFADQDGASRQDVRTQRFFGGAAVRFWPDRGILRPLQPVLESRTLVERFAGGPLSGYSRVRQRVLLTAQRPWAPMGYLETLRAHQGFRWRAGAGLQFPPVQGWQSTVGYEFRQNQAGPGIHLVTTQITYRNLRRH